jgi:hypothetical protein
MKKLSTTRVTIICLLIGIVVGFFGRKWGIF